MDLMIMATPSGIQGIYQLPRAKAMLIHLSIFHTRQNKRRDYYVEKFFLEHVLEIHVYLLCCRELGVRQRR